MRRRVWGFVFCCTVLCLPVAGYEWRSHNRTAWQARDIFHGQADSHKPPYPVDKDLRDFLALYGQRYLDARAGDESDGANVDEDSTEGRMGTYTLTDRKEGESFSYCTF